MAAELNEKRKKLKKILSDLKHKMAKFFECDENSIKFSDPDLSREKTNINAEIMIINDKIVDSKKFIASTYYFDFEIEQAKKGLWYEEEFYSYENLKEFFNKLSVEIHRLK